MILNIVDTTLRDGEQRSGVALRMMEKVQIAKILSSIGIYQIEAGIPAMGGDEKKCIQKIKELDLTSKISTWNRMSINDIKESIDCNPDIIHISIPSSDIQIKKKMQKDKEWIIDNMKICIAYAKDKGYEVTVGMEDASRAEPEFLMKIMRNAYSMGVKRIRYADTVGVLCRKGIYDEIINMKRELCNIEIEIHAHNDLGMAVSNSISAVKAGAGYVDCTIGGIGERAGNCDYLKFVTAAKAILGLCSDIDLKKTIKAQKGILKMVKAVPCVS